MPSKPRIKKADSKATTQGSPQASTSLPNWPSLQPLIPATDLALETLLQDQIIVIRKLFTATLCNRFVPFLSTLCLITTPVQPKKGNALRVNDRIQFNDPAFAEQLWTSTALRELVAGSTKQDLHGEWASGELKQLWGGEVCGLNPSIRIYRYGTARFLYVSLARIALTS